MSYYGTVLWCFVLIINLNSFISSERICPNGEPGACKNIDKCTTLPFIKYWNKTKEQREYLKQSNCGYRGEIPKVCCPFREFSGCLASNEECMSIEDCVRQRHVPLTTDDHISIYKKPRCNNLVNNICCPIPLLKRTSPVTTTSGSPADNDVLDTECSTTDTLPKPGSGCCGIQLESFDKIYKGALTDIEQYPWLVLIEETKRGGDVKTTCGGSLISAKHVLTAAHCIPKYYKYLRNKISVRLGEYDTRTSGRDCIDKDRKICTDIEISIPVPIYIRHRKYKEHLSKHHDIALLQLSRNAPYTDFIRPICLPSPDTVLSSDMLLLAAGWGMQENGQGSSPLKLHARMFYMDLKTCKSTLEQDMWKGQICTAGERFAKSGYKFAQGGETCSGDSGGPLMHYTGTHYQILGIVSFGTSYCGLGYPGVYTNVIEYLPWIKKMMRLLQKYN